MLSNGDRSHRASRASLATEGGQLDAFDFGGDAVDAAELAALSSQNDPRNGTTNNSGAAASRPLFSMASISMIAVGFIGTVEYSILMPSLNEYILKLGQSHLFYGITMGIFSFARLLCMPLLGLWGDSRPMREPLVASIIVGIIGNFMYACAYGADNAWLILFGRIIVGCGAANGALSMAYITRVTKPEDRTSAIALTNGINLIGIVVGPASNLLVTGVNMDFGSIFVFNEYTNPGWLMVILLALLLLLVLATFEEPGKMEYTSTCPIEEDDDEREFRTGSNSVVSSSIRSEYSVPNVPSPMVTGSPFFPTDSISASVADASFSSDNNNQSQSFTRSPGMRSRASESTLNDLEEPILGPDAVHELDESMRNKGRLMTAYRILVKNNLWVHFVVSFCSNFVLCELEVALPAMTGPAFGWDTIGNSFMYAFIGLFVALNLVCIMLLSKRVMDRHFIGLGLSGQLLALSFACMTLRDTKPPLAMFMVVVLVLIGACPMTGSPNMGLYTKRLQEDEASIEHIGLFVGLLQTVNGLARTIAPIFSGLALSISETDHIMVYLGPLFVVVPSLIVFWANYDNFKVKTLAR